MELVGTDFGRTKQLGRLAEVAGEQGDLLEVGALRIRGEVADLHFLDHAAAKWRHGQLLCGMMCARGRAAWSRKRSRQKNRSEFYKYFFGNFVIEPQQYLRSTAQITSMLRLGLVQCPLSHIRLPSSPRPW